MWCERSAHKLAACGYGTAAGHLPELAATPWLAHLRGLDLGDNPRGLGGCGLVRLLGGYAPPWRRLDLAGNGLAGRDVGKTDSPVIRRVVSLDLSDNPLGDRGVSLLAAAPNAAGLADLGLCGTDLGARGLAALAESPHLSNLRSLDVRGHHSTFGRTRDGSDVGGLADLARSPLLGQLRRLLVDWNGGPGNGWAADVLAFARPPRRPTRANAPWIADRWSKPVLRHTAERWRAYFFRLHFRSGTAARMSSSEEGSPIRAAGPTETPTTD